MEVDEAMKKLGKVGKWQVSIYFGIIVTLQAPLGWNTMYFILLGKGTSLEIENMPK